MAFFLPLLVLYTGFLFIFTLVSNNYPNINFKFLMA